MRYPLNSGYDVVRYQPTRLLSVTSKSAINRYVADAWDAYYSCY